MHWFAKPEILARGSEGSNPSPYAKREGGRVVDCTGLEHQHVQDDVEGSNPSLPAITLTTE